MSIIDDQAEAMRLRHRIAELLRELASARLPRPSHGDEPVRADFYRLALWQRDQARALALELHEAYPRALPEERASIVENWREE